MENIGANLGVIIGDLGPCCLPVMILPRERHFWTIIYRNMAFCANSGIKIGDLEPCCLSVMILPHGRYTEMFSLLLGFISMVLITLKPFLDNYIQKYGILC
jgi:hypothetical protein